MFRYAELKYGVVHSICETYMDLNKLKSLYPSDMVWVDISNQPEVIEGYIYSNGYFKPPSKKTTELTIDELAAAKWDEIKIGRDKAEQSGCPYMGSVFDSDELSIHRISIAVEAAMAAKLAGQDFAVDWTMKYNDVIHMNADQVIGMSVALAVFSNSLHVKARDYHDAINKAVEEYRNKTITFEEAKAKIILVKWE